MYSQVKKKTLVIFSHCFWLIICALPGTGNLLAQPLVESTRQRFNFERLTLPLGDVTVLDVVQDEQGYMWFGTHSGLVRHDGYDYKIFYNEARDSTSLTGKWIHSLEVDRQGILWVGVHGDSGGGLNRYEARSESFHRYQNNPDDSTSLSCNSITRLYSDRSGTLWVGTLHGGLNRFEAETQSFEAFYPKPDLSRTSEGANRINAIYEDTAGNFWVGTGGWWTDRSGEGALYKFDRETGVFTRFFLNPGRQDQHEAVWTIAEDQSGNLWVGSVSTGLYKIEKRTHRISNFRYDAAIRHSITGNFVTSILEDVREPGLFLIGTMSTDDKSGTGAPNLFDSRNGTFERLEYVEKESDASLSYITQVLT